jgi:hypothetical protein
METAQLFDCDSRGCHLMYTNCGITSPQGTMLPTSFHITYPTRWGPAQLPGRQSQPASLSGAALPVHCTPFLRENTFPHHSAQPTTPDRDQHWSACQLWQGHLHVRHIATIGSAWAPCSSCLACKAWTYTFKSVLHSRNTIADADKTVAKDSITRHSTKECVAPAQHGHHSLDHTLIS